MQKIYGIGTDIVQIPRMTGILKKSIAERFLKKVLHESELAYIN